MDGVRRALPIVLGYVPVAFAFGVLAVKSNIPPALVVAMSVFHFAGSGQFVCAGLWGAGVGAMSVIVAVFVVNLRHLLMSAAMAEPLAPLKRWQRFLFGCEMTDETFGVHITAFQRGWKLCTATLFTCNLTAHASWVLGTVIGVFCGGLVHDVKPLGLDYALTAMFLALLVPQCVSRLHVLVAIVTAATELGYEGKIVCGLDAAPSFNTTYGGDCSNIYYINNINTDDPTTAEMAAAVEDKVSAVNKYFLGYDVVMIAKQCIEEAGLDDAAALLAAIENVKDFKGLTGTVTIDPETHMPDGMGMFMYTYDNQTPVMLEEFAG